MPLSKLGSLLNLHKCGINKEEVMKVLTNNWEISPEEQKHFGITQYYILHWQGAHIRKQITDGIINHEERRYCVIYRGSSPSKVFNSPQVRCSFRASEFGNFVLVQPIIHSNSGQ